MPLNGWQYLTSSSQPRPATQAARGTQKVRPLRGAAVAGTAKPPPSRSGQHDCAVTTASENTPLPPLPHPTTNGSSSVDQTIDRMAPCVRRLLKLDESHTARDEPTHMTSTKQSASPHDAAANAPRPTASTRAPRPHEEPEHCVTSLLSSTLTRRRAQHVRAADMQSTLGSSARWTTTLPHRAALEPPLVTTLRSYVAKEVSLSGVGEDGALVVAERLGPYREAFAALIGALPSYAGLLSDIRSAYDDVIQAQAALLAQASASATHAAAAASDDELRQRSEAEAQELRRQVCALEQALQTARRELEGRGEAGARPATELARTQQRGYADMAKQLELAKERVAALERSSAGDLEKILVLIGAVRECDRRIKRFEETVHHMSGQIEELDEFKRLAGEAQSELQRYKDHYVQYVASSDFELMKEHLTKELTASQATARRLRRTAAVRATQNDVMHRRLQQIELEKTTLVRALAARPETDNGEGSEREEEEGGCAESALTPRPDWTAIHRELAALREEVKDVHSAPLDPSTTAGREAGVDTGATTSVSESGEVLVATGPRETGLQVRFLVQQIHSLQRELQRTRGERTCAVEALRELHAVRPPPITLAASSLTAKSQSPSSSSAPRPGSGGTNSCGPDLTARGEDDNVLVGPGMGPQVPPYLRVCGVLPRVVVQEKTRVRLIFDFFFTVVQPLFDLPSSATTDVQAMYGRFLQQQMEQQDGLESFRGPAHLALNLEEDARVPALANPPLVLLVRILHGLMPVRLAVDAVALVAHVMATLTALAEEQKKARLRREAISECLRPILELMTPRELAELRVALGNDTTYDAIVLASMESRFMRTLFFQACQAGMDLYVDVLRGLTRRAVACEEEERRGDGTIALTDVADVVLAVEPATPPIFLRELTETALKMMTDESAGGSSTTNHTTSTTSASPQRHVYLSEIIRAVGELPIIRRTAQCSREQCVL